VRWNALIASEVLIATCSLTWQVTHQAAVKSTNTGLPCALSAATRSGLQGSDGTPAATAELAAAVCGGGPNGAIANVATASAAANPASAKTPRARRPEAARRWAAPKIHAARPTSTAAAKAAARLPRSVCAASTQSSQAAAPYIGKASTFLATIIHAPGFGSRSSSAGVKAISVNGAANPSASAVNTVSAGAMGWVSA